MFNDTNRNINYLNTGNIPSHSRNIRDVILKYYDVILNLKYYVTF